MKIKDENRWSRAAFKRPATGIIKNEAALVRWVRSTVKRMDDPVNPNRCDLSDVSNQAACFLIASSLVGADGHRIGKLFRFQQGHVAEWARNLRENGLWLSDWAVVHEHWFELGGATGFVMDLMVAEGLLRCWIHSVRGRVYETVAGRHRRNQLKPKKTKCKTHE